MRIGFHAYLEAGQLAEKDFAALNELGFKLENGLLKLVESLERKKFDGAWVDSLVVKESNDKYGGEVSESPLLHHSNTPTLHSPLSPRLDRNLAPALLADDL